MKEKENIKVAIVDDKKDIRENLEILINASEGFESAGAYADYESAVKNIPKNPPDVILMDINMPGKNGIECAAKLKPLLPDVQIIMLTMYGESELVFKALGAGATGYLLKRTPPEKLLQSIVEVYNGGSPMSMEIARMVVNSFKSERENNPAHEKLSEREWEILGLLSKGLKYREIADKLFISIETVRSHCRKIYEKLQVRNSTEAVLKYLNKK